MSVRQFHIVVGLATLLAFVLTGQYMHWVHDHLVGMPDAPKLLYRTSHLYLMFSGACNLGLGTYLRLHAPGAARALQITGSVFLLVAPILIGLSFFLESPAPREGLRRPMAAYGTYLVFAGALLHGIASWMAARRRSDSPGSA